MKLFQTEIKIAATLYILANSVEEANAKADDLTSADSGIEFSNRRQQVADNMFVSGEAYSADMPEFSLSPAMTIQDSPTRHSCYETETFGDGESEWGETG